MQIGQGMVHSFLGFEFCQGIQSGGLVGILFHKPYLVTPKHCLHVLQKGCVVCGEDKL